MNKVFYENGFLTSTEAQNICNVTQEAIRDLHEKLDNISLVNTSIASVVSTTSIESGKGISDISWIPKALETIGRYNSLCAWLKEAIKDKEEALVITESKDIINWESYKEYKSPEPPSKSRTLTTLDVLKTWSKDKQFKYYSLEAKAAALGKAIHPSDDNNFATARRELSNKIANSATFSGVGRDTLIFKYVPSVESANVENLYMSLTAEHRNINSQLPS